MLKDILFSSFLCGGFSLWIFFNKTAQLEDWPVVVDRDRKSRFDLFSIFRTKYSHAYIPAAFPIIDLGWSPDHPEVFQQLSDDVLDEFEPYLDLMRKYRGCRLVDSELMNPRIYQLAQADVYRQVFNYFHLTRMVALESPRTRLSEKRKGG